ncbi:hypothetical protein HUR95_09480 [Caldalkalibacillus thermarum TA2.A1]|uniref:Uncharacterized protein n=1 Tax=Caldalkalibacillus thermarum (strain TA2.A1) TaxID=986075 RepID=A0A8X8L8Y6_CALTT|nr:hypothetical protein [Caldalkalibacillus thermarum]QZT32628.1 hypothetical protein HUR95_09480 [Caldalkalibacillus thermarum TA2.A1]
MGKNTIEKKVLAVLTTNPAKVAGGVPIFIFNTEDEVQQRVRMFESILGGMGHQIDPEVYVVIRH